MSLMYAIEFSKQARKSLKSMPRKTAMLIIEKLDRLAVDPYAPNANVKKLTNHPGFRLRIGDWRVIYIIVDDVLEIAVVRIAPQGEVYQ